MKFSNPISEAPDGESLRWALLALISVSHIVGATAQYSINTLAPFYQDDLQLSRAQIGLFFTAFYLGMAALSYAAGWLADSLGVRGTVVGGHLALGLWTVTAAFAPSFGWAFGSFLLAGLGYSFLNPATTKGVMAWFHREERATAMGIKQTGVPAGGIAAAVLGPLLVLFAGWRGALAGIGAINFLFSFFFWILWREPAGETMDPSSPERASQGVRSALDAKSLISVSFGTSLLLTGQIAFLTYIPLHLKETMGLSAYWASQALALAQLGGMTGRIGWGVVSDRLFRGRRKVVLVLIGILSAILTFGLSLITPAAPLAALVPLIFLAGLCMVGFQGVAYALVGEIAGKAQTGSALGMVLTVNSLGAIFGTPLFGYLVDATGSYPTAWRALAVAILLGIAGLLFFLKEPKPEPRPTN